MSAFNLIIVSKGSLTLFDLERRAEAVGARIKLCVDVASATHWLTNRSFDVAVFDMAYDDTDLRQLSREYWLRSPEGVAFAFSADTTVAPDREFLLGYLGLQMTLRDQGIQKIEAVLKGFAELSRRQSDPKALLVVEDLSSPRDIICVYLETLGFKDVCGVSSGQEAITILQEHPQKFSCIITDIRMPKMRGDELIELIRKDPRISHLPIVVLTAYGTPETLVRCLQAGASGFLVKPPKKLDLLRELARAGRIIKGIDSPRLVPLDKLDQFVDAMIENHLI